MTTVPGHVSAQDQHNELWSEPIMVAVPESHTLAAKEAVYRIDLRDEGLLWRPARIVRPSRQPREPWKSGRRWIRTDALGPKQARAPMLPVWFTERYAMARSQPGSAIPPIGELTTKARFPASFLTRAAGHREDAVSRHEPREHRRDELGGLQSFPRRLRRERLGVGDEIAMPAPQAAQSSSSPACRLQSRQVGASPKPPLQVG
jgi:hypothetical protein